MKDNINTRQTNIQEKEPRTRSGFVFLILALLLMLVGIVGLIAGAMLIDSYHVALGLTVLVVTCTLGFIVGPILLGGLKVVRPNEALVLTLFGRYYGTIKKDGYYFVNPFASALAPPPAGAVRTITSSVEEKDNNTGGKTTEAKQKVKTGSKISMKTMTLSNERQKINDKLGNPIIIGIVVIWRVENTVKAMFNVDDYVEYLSTQCDAALRNIVRVYPYDSCDDENSTEKSLRGSSQEISAKLAEEIQDKVEIAGLEILEARITHLAYAPEIAAAMLQRQQASAIVDARQLIVDGAVGMVEMALDKLSANNVVELDEERKAAMVSNLLVVLCGNRDAQPVVNSGSLY